MNLKKTLYYGSHRLIGSSVGKVYEQYQKEDEAGISPNRIKHSLTNLLSHCEQNVPYYADLMTHLGQAYQGNPVSYLQGLPILTKDLIRENHTRLTSSDLGKRRWRYNTSGGSTGEPVRLIQDRDFLDHKRAAQMLSFNWAGRSFGQPVVHIWGSERDILEGSIGLKMKILNYLTNDSYFNAFLMSPAKMRAFIEALNANPPKLIVAYAQAIYELANFAEQEKLTIVPQTSIITSAGTLYPFMREKIEAVFGCKVFNRYGSREVGDIACECQEHAGLHVFPWGNYVEIVDDEGYPIPAGIEGNILVTCLTNLAMPLIRYAIGDRGVLAPTARCVCGRAGQMLEKVSGRNVDAFKTKQGVLVDGEYFTHLLYFRDWVKKFQIVQKDHSLVVFKIVKVGTNNYQNKELKEITEKARAVMGSDCQIKFEFPEDILPNASGKYRYTISEI